MHKLFEWIPNHKLATYMLLYLGFTKIPLLFYIRPAVLHLSNARSIIKIPLKRRTKNHLGSMYIAAMVAGAEIAPGILASKFIKESGHAITLIFKSMHADFYKRAEGDTFFTCLNGENIHALIGRAIDTRERVEAEVRTLATVPHKFKEDPVAEFSLTLSLKMKEV